jgi:FG-GAP-like repeat
MTKPRPNRRATHFDRITGCSPSLHPCCALLASGLLPGPAGAQVTQFVLAASPQVGPRPVSVAVADVNGDGRLDLVSANASDNTLTVLTNGGDGSFGSNASLHAATPTCVVAADVNDDSTPDLIAADFHEGTLIVLTNNGRGVFGSNATLSAGTPLPVPQLRVYSIASTDVNGDGKPDLIRANHDAFSLTLWTNDGSGGLGYAGTVEVGNRPGAVISADVNGDGRLDLATANSSENTLSVLLNTPFLDLRRSANQLDLVWPYPSSGFVLQHSPDFGPTDWEEVTNAPQFVGGQNQVELPVPSNSDFFRRVHP